MPCPLCCRYATVVHKLQGSSVGLAKPLEYLYAHIANNIAMESKFLGLLYVLKSRVETDLGWEMCNAIDADRVLYVNTAKGMPSRRREDERLKARSFETVEKYKDYEGKDLTSTVCTPCTAPSKRDRLHVCLRALHSPVKFDSDCLGLHTGLVRREPEGARCRVRRRHLLLLDVARW